MVSGVARSTQGARLHRSLACPAAAGLSLRARLRPTQTRTRGTITTGSSSHRFVLRACTVHQDLRPVRSRLLDLGKLGTRLKPYAGLARLDKPIGTWLLLWPCLWSISLATSKGGPPNVGLAASFAIGALVWRGAGCTVNDLCDRNLDARVERTRSRPLPAGEVTVGQAVAFLAFQLIIGVTWFLSLNPLAKIVGLSSIGMVMAYPLMKRITYWPQLFLGFTYNWGAMMGWAATGAQLNWTVIRLLYGAGIFWTLLYDTIYANQDKKDDQHIGVKSSALALGRHNKAAMCCFAGASCALLVATGIAAGLGGGYYLGIAAVGAHFAWQLVTLDLDDRADCGTKFRSNTWIGLLVFLGILSDRLGGWVL